MQSDLLRDPNVTLHGRGGQEVQGYFPCPSCKQLRPVGLTKRRKPYLTCNDCGVQVFFRGKDGIRRLRGMLGLESTTANVRELSPLLEYTASLRNRLREIRSEKPFLGENRALEIEEKLVQSELARLETVLEMELEEKRRQLRDLRQARRD